MDGIGVGQTHHRFPGSFLVIVKTPFNKKVLVPLREQGQKDNFCGTTLFAVNSGHSARCQHTVCPLTLALRQKILRIAPVPPALGGPFAESLFALLSAMQNSLWMRPAVLLPLQWFL